MKKTLLSITLILVASISFSQLRLSGTISDAFSKTPLGNVIVSVNGSENTLITDKTGFFTVVLKESGIYDISISKNGYKSLDESLMLNEDVELEIVLTSNEGTGEADGYTKNEKVANPTKQNYLDRENPRVKREEVKKEVERIKDNSKNIGNNKSSKLADKNAFNISGEVLNAENKEAITGAIIEIKELKQSNATSPDGNFRMNINKGGTYFVSIKKKGYETISDFIPIFKDLEMTILLTKKADEYTDAFLTDEVNIVRTRATEVTPTTFKNITQADLAENNLGKDLPYLLELTPSVVASSDGGNGTGYTSMRIRGSDITRINFTLNGFPVNDAESQGVFLVNTPDIASSADDIQIQRGVGTSTNGAGAFGASVNINTNHKKEKAFAEVNNAFGTFNTFKNTIKLGTGVLFDHFMFDGRFSHISTDGYIDRASAKMFSYVASGTYFNEKSTIKFNIISGNEKTYQAWNGVEQSTVDADRTFNSAGTDYGQKTEPYNNEIDNYKQDNYQLSMTHDFSKVFSADLGFHYTKGKGYFEQYKVDEDLLDYGIINPSNNTDLVRRRWLDNDFYGTIFGINLDKGIVNATLGGGWNQYDGDHYGEIIWAKDAQELVKDDLYYFNNGLKTDFNTFLKAEVKATKRLVLFGDIQYRRVSYTAEGIDNDQLEILEDADFNFINPKVGATVIMGKKMRSQLYASFAMTNREPTRNDFIDNAAEPRAENLMDFELGFRHKTNDLNYGINAFYMKYKDQLVLTGELNDVGTAVRENVDNSFRTGLEVELAYEPIKFFGFSGAATWSLNEIEEFTFTNYLGDSEVHDKTKISYSPSFIGNLVLYTKPFKGLKFAFVNKYVGDQFLDNTSSNDRELKSYLLSDARLSYAVTPKFMREIEFVLKANNIFNTKYSANGYVYYDTPYVYPQAGTNFEGAINLKF